MSQPYTKPILVVDDDPNIVATFRRFLSSEGFEVLGVTDPLVALETARERGIELVVSDINMPEMDGLELLRSLLELDPHMLVIMMTAVGSEKVAVQAMKSGAYHYLAKPVSLDEFLLLIHRAIEKLNLIRENQVLRTEKRQYGGLEAMTGRSPSLDRVRDLVRRVASSPATVLITGESGTGKELVAEALHRLGERSDRPFVKINCAAIPETLLESELFGHERGSFTGAVARRVGKFELAHTGTIFLDEIGDMSLATQTKLLRVLQEHEFQRVGGKETISVDVRVIAATNRVLADEMAAGRFRDDLFYRLNVIEIPLPPLRERLEDVPLLVERFVDEYSRQYDKPRGTVPRPILDRLLARSWPGNIRELRNCVERAVILGLDDEANYDFAPRPVAGPGPSSASPTSEDEILTLDEVEFRHIQKVLAFTGGNKTRASRLLRIDPKTLRAKLKALERP